jgi:hypothetical protein
MRRTKFGTSPASSTQNVGQNRGSKANVFLGAAVEHHDMEPYKEADPERFISDDPYQGTPHGFLTQTSQADVLYNMMLNEAEEEFQRVHCFLAPNTSRYSSGSLANAALTQASNMSCPFECWGCVNHSNPKQHAKRYHPWRNCPHKLDPETANNAKQGLSDYYKSRDNKRRGLAAQWKEIGLPNAECGKQLNTIADPLSTAEVKRVAVATMVKSLIGSTRDPTPRASDTPSAQATQVSPLKFDFGELESGKYYPAFISYKKIRVFQAVSAKKRFKMPISEALPHIKFRIGNKDGHFQLDVAVDTCSHEFGVQRIPAMKR